MKRPLAVALTGGIAAGKSEALQAFARHGAARSRATTSSTSLYRDDEELQAALRERWGERVFRDGEVDRAEIGRIVFADRDELAWLESELHPRVRAATDAWLAEQTADVAVAEIPLLYETGGEARFDKVVVVTAPAEVREARRGDSPTGRIGSCRKRRRCGGRTSPTSTTARSRSSTRSSPESWRS